MYCICDNSIIAFFWSKKAIFQWMVDVVYGVVGRDPASDGLVDACTDAIVPICVQKKKRTKRKTMNWNSGYLDVHSRKSLQLTRSWAKSSSFDKPDNSTYNVYTTNQPHAHPIRKIIQSNTINMLYAKIKSLTMAKNSDARKRKAVNMANDQSHGRIFFSYSYSFCVHKSLKY